MLRLKYTKKFKKDYKRAEKRGLKIEKLDKIITMLAKGETLPVKYRDHQLTNYTEYDNVRECHIEPDWLLVYTVIEEEISLILLRTGTHSDLF